MGWAVGYDQKWKRDIGYGVPAICDQPDCSAEIDRGLAYVCGGEPYGGETGCGLYFCAEHLAFLLAGEDDALHIDGEQRCGRCLSDEEPFTPTPDRPAWITHKLTDPSWQRWRDEHPDKVRVLTTASGVSLAD